MLSVAEASIRERFPGADVYLYGQENNPESHAICLADMLIKGQRADNIRFADTMKEDCFPNDSFRLELINPPFGQAWGGKDAREGVERAVEREHERYNGRFPAGLPAKSDMQMLFAQHVVQKLDQRRGRACIVSNGSPLFSGGTRSGESQIRRWLLENDRIEAILALPTDLFYNTGIGIYVWVVSMDKRPERRGKVQLIDARDMWTPMRRSLGSKRKQISEVQIDEIVGIYSSFEEGEHCRILPNEEFLYKEYTVRQPYRRSFRVCEERIDAMGEGKFMDSMHNPAKLAELEAKDPADRTTREETQLRKLVDSEATFQAMVVALRDVEDGRDWDDHDAFRKHVRGILRGAGVTVAANVLEKVVDALSVRDDSVPPRRDRQGLVVYDDSTKDTEVVKLSEDVEDHFEREVYPYVPDAKWFDDETDRAVKTGAEIPFTRYFYRYVPPEPSQKLLGEFRELENQLQDELRGLV
ncbi:MAG: N-6 DNA methylase [Atopobiaceae bacterium]|jgi:type I restriction enzyme M protein|nr:N-6 DNA methylase [Atopobiaceae bacterium]MCI1388653.1 N-6 DNA methylase [Atopobiaceae bacterium]MCI1432152.1 N-6 DNA methylase [Atopobiaceae bacterium]MCI1470610.1 N-6 DNA methylase [Atopobiaceae bacterium]